MIITCSQCSAQYRYDEARFGGASVRKVKCPKCHNVFEVTNPAEERGDATRIAHKPLVEAPSISEESDSHDQPDTDQIKLAESESPELPALAPLPDDIRYSVAVIAGGQAGHVFKISKPRSYLGRGTAMDIQVRDSEVSRKHAMIEIRGDVVTLVDLGATNGTFVEGMRIESAEIANQTEFTVGSTTLMLIITSTSGNSI